MSLTDDVRNAVAGIQANYPEFSVPVVINGTAGTGLRVNDDQATNFMNRGEEGQTTGIVRVSGATFTTKPDKGATILVNDKEVVVDDASGSRILWVITYHEVRKITS